MTDQNAWDPYTATDLIWNGHPYKVNRDNDSQRISIKSGTLIGRIEVDESGIFAAKDHDGRLLGVYDDPRKAVSDVCRYLRAETQAREDQTKAVSVAWQKMVNFLNTAERDDIGDDTP